MVKLPEINHFNHTRHTMKQFNAKPAKLLTASFNPSAFTQLSVVHTRAELDACNNKAGKGYDLYQET
jgi:hypothetical protein